MAGPQTKTETGMLTLFVSEFTEPYVRQSDGRVFQPNGSKFCSYGAVGDLISQVKGNEAAELAVKEMIGGMIAQAIGAGSVIVRPKGWFFPPKGKGQDVKLSHDQLQARVDAIKATYGI